MLSFLICALSIPALAGPVEFGVAEFNSALISRQLKWKVKYELTLDPPETYRIEPYSYGGAHITGGDLRGLMYGLLDAADQIRATGRIKQTQAARRIHARGARMFVRAAEIDSFDWLDYFNTLARDRFNRFTLVFLDSPYASAARLANISQLASEFGLDFTLGIWEHEPAESGPRVYDSLRALLSACPLIRTIQLRTDAQDTTFYRDYFLKALHDTGRRVALDPLGCLAQPQFLKTITDAGVAMHSETADWPPAFTVDLPPNFKNHALLYWVWGSLGYDPQARGVHGGNPAELTAAARIVDLIAQSEAANSDTYTAPEANGAASFLPLRASETSDWIATVSEAVDDRLHHAASAKRTALEIADALLSAAPPIDESTLPDMQTLARLARYQAHMLRARYALELFERAGDPDSLNSAAANFKAARSYFDFTAPEIGLDRVAAHLTEKVSAELPAAPALVKSPARPAFTHVPVKSSPPGKPIDLTIQLPASKEIRTVRLHYRAAGAPGLSAVIEKPAAPTVAFTLPPSDVNLNYFFEILTRDAGWFEPDAFTKTPYYVIKIEPK